MLVPLDTLLSLSLHRRRHHRRGRRRRFFVIFIIIILDKSICISVVATGPKQLPNVKDIVLFVDLRG
jgi:hypothetical protein